MIFSNYIIADEFLEENYNNLYKISAISNNILYENMYDIPLVLSSIILADTILCYFFGSSARWFQLHSFINLLITIIIYPSLIKIIDNPMSGYKLLESHRASLYVLFLHIYHICAFKNLGFYDYFHHILFIGLGVIPSLLYIEYNQIYLGYIACSGIPGVIEYGTLALYKNNKISLYNQKRICTFLYIYLRFPLCIYGVSMNYVGYKNNVIKDNLLLTIYINVLLYLNGTIFTHLTCGSYFRIKYNKSQTLEIVEDENYNPVKLE